MNVSSPKLNIMAHAALAIFLLTVSTDALARGGGPGGGGGGGGSGYGGGRSGGIRSAPPGNYRMRRVYNNWERPASGSSLTPKTRTESQMRPETPASPRGDRQSPRSQGHQAVSPQGGQVNYRNITEKYEYLRETRHKEYWDQQKQQP